MKLFTMGDSLAQGFRSLAAARTDQCYSTLLSRALGVPAGAYPFHAWPADGLPANLEAIMRALEAKFGADIRGLEWLRVLSPINSVLDAAEEFYERGEGRAGLPFGAAEALPNVAFWGATVADAWQVTPALCQKIIDAAPGVRSDGFLRAPSASFFRTALKVLNPLLKPEHADKSQVAWLDNHCRSEGVENLCLFLGANNALGTVIKLDINPTPNNPQRRPHQLPFEERDAHKWNLWHPDDFLAEYDELLDRILPSLAANKAAEWRVFVGTVPLVTIAPLAKGVGETSAIEVESSDDPPVVSSQIYYKYYTYFPFEEAFAMRSPYQLTMQEAVLIDNTIRAFNRGIKQRVAELNKGVSKPRFFVVDIEKALTDMAWKRNAGDPPYDFPPAFDFIYPQVNTKYYHADPQGRLRQGGIFGLDGVHPTAIGQGLFAWEVLKVMQRQAGLPIDANSALDWPAIFQSDTLYRSPIRLMHEIYDHERLALTIVDLIKLVHDLSRAI